jgi:prepilin-type N-terminal cleavage/methylation domain-containing protein
MMTSVAKTSGPRGFTLLEIVIVLAVSAMLLGGAVGLLVFSSDQRVLNNASGEIEALAKRARTTAILQQTPYALEFRQGIVRLLPLSEAGNDEKKTAGGHRIGGEPVTRTTGERRQFTWNDGMHLFIRRWNSSDWLPTGKNSIHIWRFDPTGLCEPISVRMALNQSWEEDFYHPLTASIRDSQLEAR